MYYHIYLLMYLKKNRIQSTKRLENNLICKKGYEGRKHQRVFSVLKYLDTPDNISKIRHWIPVIACLD